MANVLDFNIRVSEFELHSRYYVHFQTNALGKGMNTLISTAFWEIVPLLFFYKNGLGIR